MPLVTTHAITSPQALPTPPNPNSPTHTLVYTSFSTELVVSTRYDGALLTSSTAIPVLVPENTALGSTNVPGGAIAGAVIGGIVLVCLITLALLGLVKRRGPLKFLNFKGNGQNGEEFNEDIWKPPQHTIQDEHDMFGNGPESDITTDDPKGQMSERRISVVIPPNRLSTLSSGHSNDTTSSHSLPPLPPHRSLSLNYPTAPTTSTSPSLQRRPHSVTFLDSNNSIAFNSHPTISRRVSAPILQNPSPRSLSPTQSFPGVNPHVPYSGQQPGIRRTS